MIVKKRHDSSSSDESESDCEVKKLVSSSNSFDLDLSDIACVVCK